MERTTSHTITLTNITESEVFCYSLPILKGYVTSYIHDNNHQPTITLRNVNAENETTAWPVVNNSFKCLVSLQPGRNKFVLEYNDAGLALDLIFRPKLTDYHVLPVYIICDGDDGRFQAPEFEDNSLESAKRRILLGSKLIQSLTAEKLYEADLGRRTFQLSSDMGQDVVVFHSRLTRDEVTSMESEDIWEHFGRELMSSSYGSDKRKFLAFLSCTRYEFIDIEPETHDDVVARVSGHVALGGGGLAIFGTGCLHTWPQYLHEVVAKFTDETRVDKTKFMDDSCYRGTYGACFSTTLGSVCHELCHTFDLGHSKKGIMGRGFDNINLVFTVGQTSDANKNVVTKNDAQHSTVCFTRDLNVTYVVSSPIRRLRGRPQQRRYNSPKRSVSECDVIKVPVSDCHNDNDRRHFTVNKTTVDDLTFWEKSCAVILKYHKWFAETDIPDNVNSTIEFDHHRNTISATGGIRVIELRGDDGVILSSWEFLSTYVPKLFAVPIQDMTNCKHVKMIVAEDSYGNIIKESLVTG